MEYAAKIAEEIKVKEIKDKEIIMSQYYANLLKVEIKLYKVCIVIRVRINTCWT